MGSGGAGGQAVKAGSVAALIYVPADIKGLCTWLFPNHYRRTINYRHSLIAIFCKWKRDNKCMPGGIGVRLWRLGWEVGAKQSGQTGPNIWKRGHFNTNPSSSPSSSQRDGGKTKNRKFHINTKKSQCKQSDE